MQVLSVTLLSNTPQPDPTGHVVKNESGLQRLLSVADYTQGCFNIQMTSSSALRLRLKMKRKSSPQNWWSRQKLLQKSVQALEGCLIRREAAIILRKASRLEVKGRKCFRIRGVSPQPSPPLPCLSRNRWGCALVNVSSLDCFISRG